MKNFIKTFVLILTFLVPVYSNAQGLVPCDGVNTPCDYDTFITLINNLADFIIIKLALPLSAIAFAYAGFLFLTSAEDPGKRTQAKSIFTNVLTGLILIGTAYLIIKLVLNILGYDGSSLGF